MKLASAQPEADAGTQLEVRNGGLKTVKWLFKSRALVSRIYATCSGRPPSGLASFPPLRGCHSIMCPLACARYFALQKTFFIRIYTIPSTYLIVSSCAQLACGRNLFSVPMGNVQSIRRSRARVKQTRCTENTGT